tara:strand:- start:1229 stop:1705 length:477 start_codon:yes stop_codon:yes gene_type:complete
MGTKMIKLKNILTESYGLGELPSSKLMKMKVSAKDMLDSVNPKNELREEDKESIGSKVEVVLSNQILDFLQQRNLITGGNAQLVHKELTAFIKNNLNADLTEGNQIKVGTIVRYKKGDGFSSGKIKSISLDKADIHNGDGSTTTLPLKDLEYVESWNN